MRFSVLLSGEETVASGRLPMEIRNNIYVVIDYDRRNVRISVMVELRQDVDRTLVRSVVLRCPSWLAFSGTSRSLLARLQWYSDDLLGTQKNHTLLETA